MQSAETKIMKSFTIYIIIFTIIIAIVGVTLTYFHSNINNINFELESNSEVTKLNLYMLKFTKMEGTTVRKYGLVDNNDLSSFYITFENRDGISNTFIKNEDILYFNKIKLCENVEEFIVDVDNSLKEVVSIQVKILGKTHNLQYVIN